MQPSPKKRRVIPDSSSEEDEFQPGQNDGESDSDSASSGVDEDTISDPEPESPEKSPPRKRPASKLPAVFTKEPSSRRRPPLPMASASMPPGLEESRSDSRQLAKSATTKSLHK
ncbi:hypothetical protein HPB50_003979 [Hyalomma asiaticum]|uniref:Uncharacterized protein n=1 Tax=Hyalomma asiaticum TaxID=266040 RepID=A0ACB7SMA1_HYAAI|nr:hypothetical protein HPB50_003979 [Hyalomma asiaticum]